MVRIKEKDVKNEHEQDNSLNKEQTDVLDKDHTDILDKDEMFEEPKPVKESKKKFWLRVLIYVVVIVVLVFLVLFLISRAALYDSIGHMLRHMWGELQLMGERIAGGARR